MTVPSVLPELDAKPSAPPELEPKPSTPLPLELPKPDVPFTRLEPLELLELLEPLELAEPELAPVRCTRTMISSKPGIDGTGTMSWRQCQLAFPNAFTSPSVVPVVGNCRPRRVSATLIDALPIAPVSYRAALRCCPRLN